MPTRRIPHFGHFLLFLLIALLSLLASEAVLFLYAAALHKPLQAVVVAQRLQLLANISTYVIALGVSMIAFRNLWDQPFLTGIRWNQPAARAILILTGLVIGLLAQGVTTLLPVPKDMPMEAIFRTPGIIWILAFFGVILGPVFEEITFRGFLLPALAIAVDYLRLPRDLQALETWRASDPFSTTALVISSILTSMAFAAIHAPQLGFSIPNVLLLAVVSLILCFIRLRTGSVAASTLVHCSYNLSVFVTLFISTGGFRHMEKG